MAWTEMCYLTFRETGSVKSRQQQDWSSHWGLAFSTFDARRKLMHPLAYKLVFLMSTSTNHMILCISSLYKDNSHIPRCLLAWTHFNYFYLDRSRRWRLQYSIFGFKEGSHNSIYYRSLGLCLLYHLNFPILSNYLIAKTTYCIQ